MTTNHCVFAGGLTLFFVCAVVTPSIAESDAFKVTLQDQASDPTKQNSYKIQHRDEVWDAGQTAVIVCDMWDAHHCYRAVLRENQMVPRMQSLLSELRNRGVTVIHAPSGCVGAYANHRARKRTVAIPMVTPPKDINSWCRSIPSEESITYPIDQSDGGEDDTKQEHDRWAKQLKAKGLNPESPWTKQHAGLTIDGETDFISDRGDEIWSILQTTKIKNVILVGVHVNMCVLGRPFGLRQLATNGVNVVLVRDLTDSMYNPKSWPYVSHQEGTSLIISHIERHVCPTITSDQILGGRPFEFESIDDAR